MKKGKGLNRKAVISALAITVGAAASASAADFSLKEINSQSVLIAHGGEGKCGEGKCGEGKCGDKKETTTKAKSAEAKCGEDKAAKKAAKKAEKKAKKSAKIK